MTLVQFIDKYKGKKIDYDNAFGGQCVDLYRQYCKEVLNVPQSPSVTGAADIWVSYLPEYFDQIKNTPEFIPQEGDIMIWNKKAGGGFGHVGVVVSADINGFTSFDQNWFKISVCELVKHTYANVYGVIRAKKTTSSELEACLTDRKKFWEERDQARVERDSAKAEAESRTTEAREIRKELDTFTETLASKLGTIADRPQIIASVERLVTQESEIAKKLSKAEDAYSQMESKYKAEIEAFSKRVESLESELAQYSSQITRLKDEIEVMKKNGGQTHRSFLDTLKEIFDSWRNKK